MFRFTLIYFHASVAQEDIELQLLKQLAIDFDCQGVHYAKRVYLIKARRESDINNVHRFERYMNSFQDEPFEWVAE